MSESKVNPIAAGGGTTVDVRLPDGVSIPTPFGGSMAGIRGDDLLLGSLALGALSYFSTFSTPLKRSALDCAADESIQGCESGDLAGSCAAEGEEADALRGKAASSEAEMVREVVETEAVTMEAEAEATASVGAAEP